MRIPYTLSRCQEKFLKIDIILLICYDAYMKRFLLLLAVLSFCASFFLHPVMAEEKTEPDDVTIYLFHSQGCPHCHKEREFLEKLNEKYANIHLQMFEITTEQENALLYQKVGQELGAQTGSVPFTVIGQRYIVGYGSDDTTGREIEQLALAALHYEKYTDVVASIMQNKTGLEIDKASVEVPEFIDVPLVGKIETQTVSLPVLTFVIAFLDGFNPCAMWVLVFLISMLLGMKNRVKMWILGSVFIVASAAVYYLFMTAWLNFFLFVGFIYWVRIAIGIFALGVGGYYLWDYVTNKKGQCAVTGNEKRRKILDKIKDVVYQQNFFLAVGGIILLAFAVNIIEAICSAGLPAIYTQVLTLSNLPPWQYYAYILFYIFVFMIDDLIVFIGAMISFHHIGFDTKYARYSHLIGGILILGIGIILLFKPEWLMFG